MMTLPDLIDHFLILWPKAAYGPGHAVLDDLNLELQIIDFCIICCSKVLYAGDPDGYMDQGHTRDEIVATYQFLCTLCDLVEGVKMTYDQVLDAIHGLYGDTGASVSTIRENLMDLRAEIQMMLESLPEEEGED